jgi:hypothetical protein
VVSDGREFEQGSWVHVWARVLEQRRVHPEDLVVVVLSHNADEQIHVRRTHISIPAFKPAWQQQCSSMVQSKVGDGVYLRCARPAYHDTALRHRRGEVTWTDAEANGNMELE